MASSFYTENELNELGFKRVGRNVLISRKVSIYGADSISIGDNVRIDDFCILSGHINLSSYIHISAYCVLYGGKTGIFIDDFSGISARTTIYSVSDDFSGEYMVGAMVENKYRNVIEGSVKIGKYVQLGANCVVFPNLEIHDGVAVGAMSLINKSLISWNIYAGIPCRLIKPRKMDILQLRKNFDNNA